MLELTGYFASALIGLSLGLIGGGGSILTVPILVYLFKIDPVLATSYSLFVVGTTSLVGAFLKYKNDLVDFKTALIFGLPSIISIYITRHFILPALPENFGQIEGLLVTKALFLLLLFSVLMIVASFSMIISRSEQEVEKEKLHKTNYLVIVIDGVAIGILTGFVGAGGGFLIIPALIFLCGLKMKKAIGTSLMIITLNSLFGFIGDFGHYKHDWIFLVTLSAIAVFGLLVGNHLNTKIQGAKLKKGFGWFVLVVGVLILIKETLLT